MCLKRYGKGKVLDKVKKAGISVKVGSTVTGYLRFISQKAKNHFLEGFIADIINSFSRYTMYGKSFPVSFLCGQ